MKHHFVKLYLCGSCVDCVDYSLKPTKVKYCIEHKRLIHATDIACRDLEINTTGHQVTYIAGKETHNEYSLCGYLH